MRSLERLVLASASPSRKAMLTNAGIAHEALPARIDERATEAFLAKGLSPEQTALILAEAKACAISESIKDCLVIGCDQILSVEGTILHKPINKQQAYSHLSRMSGKTHFLHAAAVLFRDGKKLWEHIDTSRMTMRHLLPCDIENYLDHIKNEDMQTAGIYRIEAEGIHLFQEMEGSFFSIMGLPLLPLLQELRRQKVIR